MNQIEPPKSTEFFKGASNIYAICGTRDTERWGVGISAGLSDKGGTVIVLRFAILCGDYANVKTKLFKKRHQQHFGLKDGSSVSGWLSHKLNLPFAKKPIGKDQFIALCNEHEVWEKLEALVINAFAYEGIELIKGQDIAKLFQGSFEVPASASKEVGYEFEMPNIGVFNGFKPKAAEGEQEPNGPSSSPDKEPPKPALSHEPLESDYEVVSFNSLKDYEAGKGEDEETFYTETDASDHAESLLETGDYYCVIVKHDDDEVYKACNDEPSPDDEDSDPET